MWIVKTIIEVIAGVVYVILNHAVRIEVVIGVVDVVEVGVVVDVEVVVTATFRPINIMLR